LEQYEVEVASSAREAGRLLVDPEGFEVIVLDVMLPDVDGFELCRRLRGAGNYTPVIMLTALTRSDDRVVGLEAGADDYLGKPFELAELLARVRSLIRRTHWTRERVGVDVNPTMLRFGQVVVDFESHRVEVAGVGVRLTKLELDLLRYFGENAGRVISRAELLDQVWNLAHHLNTRTVDNFIVRLRRHLEPDPQRPVHFISVRGVGYKFEPT